jgi:hypothetical protein
VTPDTITLTLPPEREFQRVAHLVLGGLAVRLNLTLEALEDLQLALDGVLPRSDDVREITVGLRVENDEIIARIGPFERQALQHELDREDGGPGLRRVLETVADGHEVEEEAGSAWVVLHKQVS